MKLLKFNGKKGYKKLNHLPFNRDFTVRTSLEEKMILYGYEVPIILIKTDLITGVEELFIADGQFRAVTAAHLNILFYGILKDRTFKTIGEIVNYVASLNSTQEKWTNRVYVKAFTYLGLPEYIKLNRYVQESPFTLSAVACMLHGIRSKGATPSSLRDGTFACNLEEEFKYTNEVATKARKATKRRITGRMGLGLHYVASDDFTDLFLSWMRKK